MVYGYNPRTPLDLVPVPNPTKFNWEAEKRVNEIQERHTKVRKGLRILMSKQSNVLISIEKMYNFSPKTWFGFICGTKGILASANPNLYHGED